MVKGRGRIVVIDCQLAGVSGDRFVGALVDLGADAKKVVEAMRSVKDHIEGCKSLDVRIHDVIHRGFSAKVVEIKAEEEVDHREGIELRNAVSKCVKDLDFSRRASKFSLDSIDTLIEAEGRVHGKPPKGVHLHELGSVDTVADIIGVATALENLDLFRGTRVYSTPVAVGGGLIKISHGTVPSPSPATLEILRSKNFTMIGGPIEAELTTPTGAALLTNLASATTRFYPPITPLTIGCGAGAKDLKEIPNILKIILGKGHDYGLLSDEICVLETNLDDVSGEIVGGVTDKLFKEGARDVSIIPMFTKKSRPGYVVKVIINKDDADRLSRVLIDETGTLGVRLIPCYRRILAREIIPIAIEIEGIREKVRVKVVRDSKGNILRLKPEYDDAKRLADKVKKPLREVIEIIGKRAKKSVLK